MRWYSNASTDGIRTLRVYRVDMTGDVAAVALVVAELGRHGKVWSLQRSQPGSDVRAGKEVARIHWLASATLEARSSRIASLEGTVRARVRSAVPLAFRWEAATLTEGGRADLLAAAPASLVHNQATLERAAAPTVTERASAGAAEVSQNARTAAARASETLGAAADAVGDELGDAAAAASNTITYIKASLAVVAGLLGLYVVAQLAKGAR